MGIHIPDNPSKRIKPKFPQEKHRPYAIIVALAFLFIFITLFIASQDSYAMSKFARSEPEDFIQTRNLPRNPYKTTIGTIIRPSDPTDPDKPALTMTTKNKKIKMSVMTGVMGFYHPQRWLPVQFVIENSGPPVSGYVEVLVDSPEGNYPLAINRKKLDLPEGARKKAELCVLTEQPAVTVRYVSNNKTLLQIPVTTRWIDLNLDIVGVLTDEGANMNFYKDIVSAKRGSQLAVFNSAGDIPESGLALDSLDVLIINGTSTKDLSAKQQKAILYWVKDGGTLILGGGPDISKVISNLPRELIPVEIGENKTVQDLPTPLKQVNIYTGHGPYIYTTVKDYEGEVILGEKRSPYIVGKELGKGNLIWIAFDLSSRPFSEWRENEKIWGEITQFRSASPQKLNGAGPWYGSLSGLLFNIPALKAPSLTMVLALLFLYMLLVSPINYFLLKKFDRREWAWITIPILIAIFGLSTYWYAYISKGGDVIINQIGVIEASPSESTAKIYNIYGIFSPGKRSYTVRVPKGMTGSPVPGYYYDGPRVSLDPAIIDEESGVISDFSIAAWTMRSFLTTGIIDLKNSLDCDLRYTRDGVEGKIVNNFDFPLNDMFFVAGNHVNKVGSIRPGAEKRVTIRFKDTPTGPFPLGERLFAKKGRFKNMGGPESYQQGSFLKIEMLNQIVGYEGEIMPEIPTLIAWTSKPLATPKISGKKPIYRGQTMLLLPVNINSHDYFTIHPGQIKRSLINKKGNFRTQWQGFSVSNGSAEFEYKLPVEKKYKPLELNLYLGPEVQRAPRKSFDISVFNIKSGKWTQLDKFKIKNGSAKVKSPQDYISADNKIKARIDVSAKRWGEVFFRKFDFEVIGKWL